MNCGIISSARRRSSAAPFAHSGALVHITDNSSTALTSGTAISYDNIDYDVQGWRTSSTTLTTPGTLPAGTLMRLFSSFYSQLAGAAFIRHNKGGASFAGEGNGSCSQGGGQGSIWSAIIPAVAAEAFTTVWNNVNDTTQQDGRNWMGVEILAPSTRYTFAGLASAQTVVNADGVKPLPWTHTVDTMGAHSNTTNTTRFTVPSDTTGKVRLTAAINTNTAPGSFESNLSIGLNGAAYGCRDSMVTPTGGNFHFHRVVSPITDVVAGDYLEARSFTTGGTLNYPVQGPTWACFEELRSDVRYVLVNRATNLALISGDQAIAFDGEIHDPEGCHSTSTNLADIVVPAGATKAQCSFGFDVSSAAVSALAWITRTRSGTTIKINGGGTSTQMVSNNQFSGCALGDWIDVQAGDILRLHIASGDASTLNANTFTWFQVEFE